MTTDVTVALDPFAPEFLADPYPAHEALRDAGPAVRLERYGIWASARHAPVRTALLDPDAYCSSAGVGISDFRKEEPWRPPSLLLEADPPEHTRARRVVAGVLSAAAMPSNSDPPPEGRENLLGYARMMFNTFGPRNELFVSAVSEAGPTREWIMDHCREENLLPGGMGAEIHARAAAEGYSPDQAAMLVRSFLSAGVDTTVHGLGNALLCLAQHPEQYAALRAEPGKAPAAFEEVLRFEAPVQTFFRTTTRPVELDGVAIGEGENVLLFLGAANRDPRQWDEPDTFDISRRATGHVGFGFGIHVCVGMAMARLEGEAVLTALAGHVAEIEQVGEPRRMLNNTLRGLERLPLRLVPA